MENTETSGKLGGSYFYFQGATINNMVINGNMQKSGPDQFKNESQGNKNSLSAERIMQALQQCKDYIWGNAAYSIAFCVCRDVYSMDNNATSFERLLAEGGIELPAGTINACMNRNPWMKLRIDKWDEKGAMGRALKLRDAFMQQLEVLTIPATETA
jgi:hypothetical protein